jgi:hypothetical protein
LRREDVADCSVGKRFRFAVVDLDRAKDFPLNFVCMLPLRVSLDERKACIFSGVFGDRSLEMAKKLLVDALKVEADSDVKAEIGRRLKLLEPDSLIKEDMCVLWKNFSS